MTSKEPRLGEGLSLRRMPAHWMLGRLGKRVMRPGGFGSSRWLIDRLRVGPDDDVVEMWPGLGRTTALALTRTPCSYVGIERGEAEAARARRARTAATASTSSSPPPMTCPRTPRPRSRPCSPGCCASARDR